MKKTLQMSKLLAKIISILISPPMLLFPAPFMLVYDQTGNLSYSILWTSVSNFFLFLMIAFVLIGIYIGVFSDFDVTNRKERPTLVIGSVVVVFLYIFILIFLKGPRILGIVSSGLLIGALLVNILDRWLKVSIHTASVASFTLGLVILYGVNFIPLLLLIPIMAWSRLTLKKHTLAETITGGFLGFILTIIVYITAKVFLI